MPADLVERIEAEACLEKAWIGRGFQLILDSLLARSNRPTHQVSPPRVVLDDPLRKMCVTVCECGSMRAWTYISLADHGFRCGACGGVTRDLKIRSAG